MQLKRKVQTLILASLLSSTSFSFSQEISFDDEGTDSNLGFHIQPEDNFQNVVQYMHDYLEMDALKNAISDDLYADNHSSNPSLIREFILTVGVTDEGYIVSPSQKAAKSGRNYYAEVTAKEKKNIRTIVTTLGFDSILAINSAKSNLKRIGKEIDHIHPLKFLQTVFTDEELKAGIAAIRDRAIGWIWDEFSGGLIGSLKEETTKQNMKPEFIQDFARKIPINADLITPSLRDGRFKDFINILIDKVPRQNNPNRYNM